MQTNATTPQHYLRSTSEAKHYGTVRPIQTDATSPSIVVSSLLKRAQHVGVMLCRSQNKGNVETQVDRFRATPTTSNKSQQLAVSANMLEVD